MIIFLMIVVLLFLIQCVIVLGVELFREANREAEEREQNRKKRVRFNGRSWIEEEMIIRKLLKNERTRL